MVAEDKLSAATGNIAWTSLDDRFKTHARFYYFVTAYNNIKKLGISILAFGAFTGIYSFTQFVFDGMWQIVLAVSEFPYAMFILGPVVLFNEAAAVEDIVWFYVEELLLWAIQKKEK